VFTILVPFAFFCTVGTVLDLPYTFVADGTQEEMSMPPDFDFATLTNLFQTLMAEQAAGGGDPVAMLMKMCGAGCNIL
jgi:hypothetical protein